MSSIPLYKAFIEVGASEDSATKAAEDVIRVSQLEQLATKSDLKSEIAGLEARLVKWMKSVGSLFVRFCRHHHRQRWHTYPNLVVPRSCSVNCKSGDRSPLTTCGGMLEIFTSGSG